MIPRNGEYKVMSPEIPGLRRPPAGTAMRIAVIALIVVIASLPCATAQAGDSSQNKGSIHGTVIDSKTGQPIKNAEVSLRTFPAGNRGEPGAAASDAEGHFVFDNLPAGQYRVTTSRNGYINRARGLSGGMRPTTVTVSSGQTADTVVRLIPSSVISGRVTSEGDEPVPNVNVQAMKYAYQNDRRQLTDVGTASTNDRGEYRIWGLPPGKYYVRATHPRAQAVRPGSEVYVPIFYPNVTDPSRTQPLDLHPGDELSGIDLSLVSLRSVRVSGHVQSSTSLPGKNIQISLIGGTGATTFNAGQASTDAKGNFEIRGVPPGSYTLIAEQFAATENDKVMRGRTSLEVGDVNVNDAEVITGPGTTVTGHVRIEGKSNADLGKMNVSLDPQDDLASLGFAPDESNVAVRPDGTFTFHDVPEGTYRINVRPLPNGYYLKPSGEGDAIESGVKVGRNHAAAVEITLSTGAGRVNGTVAKEQQPSAGATVVLVPDPPRRGEARLYRQALADSGGRFSIAGVPPGDYKLFAWDEIDRGAYLDPDFLQAYEDSGKPVKVDDGANQSVQVELIAAGDGS